MKKSLFIFAAIAATSAALINGCTKCQDWPETPVVHNVVTSDCHHYTDPIAAKEMNTDSIVVEWDRESGSLSVSHYNMMLDCGMRQPIPTTILREGDTIRVTEHVGEQGLTNCVCLYDNSFNIEYLPETPFTLVIEVETLWFDQTETTTVYENSFN